MIITVWKASSWMEAGKENLGEASTTGLVWNRGAGSGRLGGKGLLSWKALSGCLCWMRGSGEGLRGGWALGKGLGVIGCCSSAPLFCVRRSCSVERRRGCGFGGGLEAAGAALLPPLLEPRARFSTRTRAAWLSSKGLAARPMSFSTSPVSSDSVKLLNTGGGIIMPSGRSDNIFFLVFKQYYKLGIPYI